MSVVYAALVPSTSLGVKAAVRCTRYACRLSASSLADRPWLQHQCATGRGCPHRLRCLMHAPVHMTMPLLRLRDCLMFYTLIQHKVYQHQHYKLVISATHSFAPPVLSPFQMLKHVIWQDDAAEAEWHDVAKPPQPLAFDHKEIIRVAFQRLLTCPQAQSGTLHSNQMLEID